MAKQVFKYEVEVDDEVFIEVPYGAELLSVGTQRAGRICVWMLVDANHSTYAKRLLIRGTGHPVPENVDFVGTVFDRQFVWHVFDPRQS